MNLAEVQTRLHELGFQVKRLPNGAGYSLSAPGRLFRVRTTGPRTKAELARQRQEREAATLLADHWELVDQLATDAQDGDA